MTSSDMITVWVIEQKRKTEEVFGEQIIYQEEMFIERMTAIIQNTSFFERVRKDNKFVS